MILLVVWSANGDARYSSAFTTSKASCKVNLLSDDTYRWNWVTVIIASFWQGVHSYEIFNLVNEESISIGSILIYTSLIIRIIFVVT